MVGEVDGLVVGLLDGEVVGDEVGLVDGLVVGLVDGDVARDPNLIVRLCYTCSKCI